MWGAHEGMGWWMVFGSVGFIVLWGLAFWALASVLRRPEGSVRDGESALDIARRRYARGEINREQFEQIRRDLTA